MPHSRGFRRNSGSVKASWLSSCRAQAQQPRFARNGCLTGHCTRTTLVNAASRRALADNLRDDLRGELIVFTAHTQARFVLLRAVANHKGRFPDVGVHLQPQADIEFTELLGKGDADLAIASTVEPSARSDFANSLFRWVRVVLMPVTHPLALLGRAPTIVDIAVRQVVSHESSLAPASSLRKAFAAAGFEPKLAHTARDVDLLKTQVRAGLGVGVLAEMALASQRLLAVSTLPSAGRSRSA